MKEEDNIEQFFKNNEVKSFDIKQEWLDDVSAQLDAYNSKNRTRWHLWLLALVPIVSIIVLIASLNSGQAKKQYASRTTKTTVRVNKYQTESEIVSIQEKNKPEAIQEEHSTNINQTLELKHENPNKTKEVVKPLKKLTLPTVRRNNPKNSFNTKAFSKKTLLKAQKTDSSPLLNDAEQSATSNISNSEINQPKQKESIVNSSNDNSVLNETESEVLNQINQPDSKSEIVENGKHITNTKEAESEQKGTPEIKKENLANNGSSAPIDSSDNEQTTDKIENKSLDIDELNTDDDIIIDQSGDKDKLWFAGFTLGPDLLERQLKSTSDQQNFQQKKDEESMANTLGFDFELGRYLTPWLTAGTGIGYKTYKETNSYSATSFITNDTIVTTINNTYFIPSDSILDVDVTGDTVWVVIDSTEVIETEYVTEIKTKTEIDSSKKVANGPVTSSYFQIPLTMQLIFANTDKLTAYANISLSVGVLTKNTGMVLAYGSDAIETYKTRDLIFNSTIGLGFNYNFYGPFDYKLFAAYHSNLSNLSLAPNIDKRYTGINFRTGLVFHF